MNLRLAFRALAAAALAVGLQACVIQLPPLFGGGRGPVQLHQVIPAEHFWTVDEVLVIDLTGIVSIEGTEGWFGAGGPGMLVELKDRLDEAQKNSRLKAVILRIDSPGGGVTASDLIHHEILEFKKEKKVPVVAMMQDVAASGGLYIAMAADEIYALPTTVTGSIGVITTLPSIEELSEKIGLEMRVIKSGKNKDLGSPWRSLTDEEKKLFQDMIDKMYQRFLDVILTSRAKKGLTREKLTPWADGRVLDGAAAAELGLIDGVLYTNEMLDRVKKIAGVTDAVVVSYEYPYGYRGNFYAGSPAPRPALKGILDNLNPLRLDLGLTDRLHSGPRFLYMWLP